MEDNIQQSFNKIRINPQIYLFNTTLIFDWPMLV